MTAVSAGVAAQAALTQQAIALEVLRSTAQLQQQSMAALLESIVSVPTSGTRGAILNISA